MAPYCQLKHFLSISHFKNLYIGCPPFLYQKHSINIELVDCLKKLSPFIPYLFPLGHL